MIQFEYNIFQLGWFNHQLLNIDFSKQKSWTSIDMGVSLNGDTPNLHPKMIIFSRKTPWLLGKPTILGTPHIVFDWKVWFFSAQTPAKVTCYDTQTWWDSNTTTHAEESDFAVSLLM